jgi:hypothetical protein
MLVVSNTHAQQAALKSNALVAKLEAVDVGGALSPAVVQKLAEKMVKVPKSSPESKAEAVKAAEDITKVRYKTLFMAHHLTSTHAITMSERSFFFILLWLLLLPESWVNLQVITDGKLDDESVKSVLADSRTHHGKDSGSTL